MSGITITAGGRAGARRTRRPGRGCRRSRRSRRGPARRRQAGDPVVGAAQLEAEDGLQVLALQQDRAPSRRREARRRVERGLAGDVVDAARQHVVQQRGRGLLAHGRSRAPLRRRR